MGEHTASPFAKTKGRWKKLKEAHCEGAAGKMRMAVQEAVNLGRQRELKELLFDFKAQHRAGVCRVPTFRQLLRLQYPSATPEDLGRMLKYVAKLESIEQEQVRKREAREMHRRKIET
eukprot:1438369-Prymnesium_polylepis.1